MTKLPEQLMHHLDQIGDEVLRNQILQEMSQLNRGFGMVFERHIPEGIRMPERPITVGAKACITHRSGKLVNDPIFYKVAEVNPESGTAFIQGPDGATTEHPLNNLVAGKEFGDIAYPGLKVLKEVQCDSRPDAPTHTIINGENLHVLEALQWTHAGALDLLYADPPYRTGNSGWKYNDRFVDSTDDYRHSKWLSFLEKRLQLARTLLKPTGVILVAIGDDQHHRLRMLLDHVFGEENFLANITWQGSVKNDAQLSGGGADYMLAYAKDVAALTASGRTWREPKAGVGEVLDQAQKIWQQCGPDADQATRQLRLWMSKNRHLVGTNIERYNMIDDQGRCYQHNALNDPRKGLTYDLIHPATGLPVKAPRTGWRMNEEKARQWIEQGRISFGKDETTVPNKKNYLKDSAVTVAAPTFTRSRRIATDHLSAVLGDKRFPYPKDHEVLLRWIRMVAPKDAAVLDFFGGSGTTAEAVMRLNEEDGGTRQCILVTNNELAKTDDTRLRKAGHLPGDAEYERWGVFHHVTLPRLETVVTGIREDGSKYSYGLEANLAILELSYLEEAEFSSGNTIKDLAGLFWLKVGGRGPIPVPNEEDLKRGFALAGGVAILIDAGSARALKEVVTTSGSELRALFIMADSDTQGDEVAGLFEGGPYIERIYGRHLEALQVNRQG